MCMGITDEESLHQQTQLCKSAILQKKYTLTLKKKTRINEPQDPARGRRIQGLGVTLRLWLLW